MEEDGYVVIKNIFTKEEVLEMRKIMRNHFKHNNSNVNYLSKSSKLFSVKMLQPLAAIHIPSLWWLFSHPNIVRALRIFLPYECVFTNVADAQIASRGGWHKDDGTARLDNSMGYFRSPKLNEFNSKFTNPYMIDNCKVFKIAIYLQDHSNDSSGLFVRPGSHKTSWKHSIQTPKYLGTKPGDIVIFDVRISHSGRLDPIPLKWNNSNIWLKNLFSYLINIPKIGRYLEDIVTTFYDIFFGKKFALFLVYGDNNIWTKNYSDSLIKGMINQVRSRKTRLSKKIINNFIKAKIKYF